jgi:hypothetical protein
MRQRPQIGVFMKKLSVLLAMLALVLVVGMAFVGCKNEPEVPKSITVTGINRTGITTNARVNVISNEGDENYQGQVAEGSGNIVNQTLSVDLYTWTADSGRTQETWTGSGKWVFRLNLYASSDNHQITYLWKGGEKYDIKDAVTTLNFADFVLVWEAGQ